MGGKTPAETAMDDQLLAGGTDAASRLSKVGWPPEKIVPVTDETVAWVQEIKAALGLAVQDRKLKRCSHMNAPQASVVLAEDPRQVLCWSCYEAAREYRTCVTCKKPAGTSSLLGGLETVMRGPALVYSRVLCMPCGPKPAPVTGTFGR